MIYGYIRVSTPEQVLGTSLGDQRREVEGNAQIENLTIDRVIEDKGVSGADGFFDRLSAHDIVLEPGDVIIVSKIDRFSRNLRDALNAIHTLKNRNVRLIINGYGDVTNTDNLTGQLAVEIMTAFSGHERRLIRSRVRGGQRAKRAAGGFIGGIAPFGFKKIGAGKESVLVKDEVEQDAIKTILRAREDQCLSFRRITEVVFELHNLKISHEAVRKVIQRGGNS